MTPPEPYNNSKEKAMIRKNPLYISIVGDGVAQLVERRIRDPKIQKIGGLNLACVRRTITFSESKTFDCCSKDNVKMYPSFCPTPLNPVCLLLCLSPSVSLPLPFSAYLSRWVEENEILGEIQADFRKNHSATDHIFTLYDSEIFIEKQEVVCRLYQFPQGFPFHILQQALAYFAQNWYQV